MATQYFKRNLLLNLYREEKKICFLLPLKRDKKCLTLEPISSIWRPLAFLPVSLSLTYLQIFTCITWDLLARGTLGSHPVPADSEPAF